MVRYSSQQLADMNGCPRKFSHSQRTAAATNNNLHGGQYQTTSANGNQNSGWKLTRVFTEYEEALINRKLPKELLLRVFSHLDVVSLCRCAQVTFQNSCDPHLHRILMAQVAQVVKHRNRF